MINIIVTTTTIMIIIVVIIMIIIVIIFMIRSGATVPTSRSPTRQQKLLHRKTYIKINIFMIIISYNIQAVIQRELIT